MNISKLHTRIVLLIAFQLYSMNSILLSNNDSNFFNKITINIYFTNIGILFKLIPIIYFLFYKTLNFEILYSIIILTIILFNLLFDSYTFFNNKNLQRYLKIYSKINKLNFNFVSAIDLFLTMVLWLSALSFYLNFGI